MLLQLKNSYHLHKDTMQVSIPRAVGVVATYRNAIKHLVIFVSFNTASGRCCCNVLGNYFSSENSVSFNTASGRCCCNTVTYGETLESIIQFQYRER